MIHAKPIHMAITTLYQNDVQFGDKRIPFKMVKCITKIVSEYDQEIPQSQTADNL